MISSAERHSSAAPPRNGWSHWKKTCEAVSAAAPGSACRTPQSEATSTPIRTHDRPVSAPPVTTRCHPASWPTPRSLLAELVSRQNRFCLLRLVVLSILTDQSATGTVYQLSLCYCGSSPKRCQLICPKSIRQGFTPAPSSICRRRTATGRRRRGRRYRRTWRARRRGGRGRARRSARRRAGGGRRRTRPR